MWFGYCKNALFISTKIFETRLLKNISIIFCTRWHIAISTSRKRRVEKERTVVFIIAANKHCSKPPHSSNSKIKYRIDGKQGAMISINCAES